jgi:adenosylcobinamide-GDP ribazoletransferase
MRALRALAESFAYFSVFPMGSFARTEAPDALAFTLLPVVGAAVGAIAGAAGYGAFAWLHAPWAFVVAWAAAIALTGAVHVDGFLDSCDGLLVTAAPAERLGILKDPRHGSFAVVGMAIVSAFWLAALASIPPARYPLALAFTSAASRLAVVPNAWIFPYARAGAMSHTFAAAPDIATFAIMLAIVEIIAWLVHPAAIVIAPAGFAVSVFLAAWASRRLGGGITGDVYGAIVVVLDVAMLLALTPMLSGR